MAKYLDIVKVMIPSKIIDRRDWIKYLVLVKWHSEELGNKITKINDAAFEEYLEGHIKSYFDGKQLPSEIQTAIMNIADDVLSGREVTVRAGDYISLQNYYRKS